MAKLINKELRDQINFNGHNLNVDIDFYQSNGMPALSLLTDKDELFKDLTTNYNDEISIDRCVAIRSDESENYKILLENGWIEPERYISIPQGFTEIVFYKLTDEAYSEISRDWF